MKLRASALALLLSTTFAGAALAEPSSHRVVDRIVAVVVDEIVTLVELRERAKPFVTRISSSMDESERPLAEARLQRELLDAMIDERVIARFAAAQQLAVSAKEIEDAIGTVAAQNQMSVDDVLEQARAQGMETAVYRNEIERQLLRYKVLRAVLPTTFYDEHRGRPEAEMTEAMDAFFKTWLGEQKAHLFIEVRL